MRSSLAHLSLMLACRLSLRESRAVAPHIVAEVPSLRQQTLICRLRFDIRGPDLQEMGSMLLATTADQEADLAVRQASLAAAGVHAELLERGQLLQREPALQGSSALAGLIVAADAQLVRTGQWWLP